MKLVDKGALKVKVKTSAAPINAPINADDASINAPENAPENAGEKELLTDLQVELLSFISSLQWTPNGRVRNHHKVDIV